MNWKVIKTKAEYKKAEYKKAVKRTMEILHAGEGTPEADELALLLEIVKDYEDKHIMVPEVNPIEVIKAV